MRTIFAFIMLAGVASGQNSDLGLLAGIAGPKDQTTVTDSTTTASGSVAPSFQVNYAWQVRESTADLYIELPLVVPVRESGAVVAGPGGTAVSGSSGPDLFFTPGLRMKVSPESRVSFYAAAGLGVASFGATSTIGPSLTVVTGSRQTSLAFGFGGGVDFRLTRLLSLRADVRDFVTRAGLGGASGRIHAILQAGIAFHF
jgi:opacity protein-like surface antigen